MSLFRKQGSPSDETNRKSTLALRINVFFFSTFVIFCVIIIRLAVLQFVEGPTLTEVEANRDTKDVPLAAMRGSILAAGGEKIAYSTPVQSLYITLTKEYTEKKTDKTTEVTDFTPEAKAKVDKLAADLVDKFNELGDSSEEKLTVEQVKESFDLNFRKYNGYTPRRIKVGLSTKEVAYFMEHKDEYPGLEVVEENVRHYDKDTVAVQTVGYVKLFKNSNSLPIYQNILNAMKKKDSNPGLMYKDEEYVGFDGLERQYQRELRGQNGYLVISINPQNMADKIEKVVPPVKGNDIWMTTNKNVQLKTQQAITDQIKWLHTHAVQGKTHPNAITGYAVAMEVDTGNIVAMASMPDYDTNAWVNGNIMEIWDAIQNNYQNGTITPIMAGRSGHGFESIVLLGSTVKPLSVLLGLNEGLFKTSDWYTDTGITSFGKAGYETKVRNASGHVLGRMYPAEAIAQSSNVFMVDMVGKKLNNKYGSKGIDVWDKYMKEFGLGVFTGVDLPNEHRGQINYRKEAKTGSVQSALVYASFGQQGAYTTLQLAQYASTLANKGERIKPHLVSKITDSSGKVVKTFGREVLNTVKMDDSYWNEVKKGMNSKVDVFDGFPYDFARKTGTSQQDYYDKSGKHTVDNGVFIAYAPRNKPKLAVAVIIPEGGFGSNSAAPVARKIFDAYDWEYGLDGVPKKSLQQNQAAQSGTNQ
ncbi:Cell division protein FtsI/penicillin-binding protein 2 [Paenibacillus sophorae]|uniref:Penicillin-binding protein 2 n=1 Tax=Paenibacillus sophorae TaxID=1333845 RepID=A0A1H8UVI8_9BACL|nr:penicillin-binding transpeptidase domain-containing protein [Paenibacillus sophorae]QWU15348.1 penicillin-binding protein 2 [Paenibacillus sophorae]SEP07156.1 Cell division protein FtsI/penicillin-binding protein 2 [Paenibacillus sophorae]